MGKNLTMKACLESTILFLDDNSDLLDLMGAELLRHFSRVLTVDRAQKAIEMIESNQVDCVITDYKMPEMNGLEFISFLQKHHAGIPIIMLTGNGSESDVLNSIQNGVFDYVEKPFNLTVLINRIHNALLIPRLESLILEFVKLEFPEVSLERLNSLSHEARLHSVKALEAILRTRLIAKSLGKAV